MKSIFILFLSILCFAYLKSASEPKVYEREVFMRETDNPYIMDIVVAPCSNLIKFKKAIQTQLPERYNLNVDLNKIKNIEFRNDTCFAIYVETLKNQ